MFLPPLHSEGDSEAAALLYTRPWRCQSRERGVSCLLGSAILLPPGFLSRSSLSAQSSFTNVLGAATNAIWIESRERRALTELGNVKTPESFAPFATLGSLPRSSRSITPTKAIESQLGEVRDQSDDATTSRRPFKTATTSAELVFVPMSVAPSDFGGAS